MGPKKQIWNRVQLSLRGKKSFHQNYGTQVKYTLFQNKSKRKLKKAYSFFFKKEEEFPATTRVWRKISYGDEWTSCQTFNCLLCICSRKTFFLCNQLKISTVTYLVENFKSERVCCKISASKKLGHVRYPWYALAKRE